MSFHGIYTSSEFILLRNCFYYVVEVSVKIVVPNFQFWKFHISFVCSKDLEGFKIGSGNKNLFLIFHTLYCGTVPISVDS